VEPAAISNLQDLVPRSTDHEVHVCWAIGMSSCRLEHVSHWPVVWDGIELRHDRPEVELALRICVEPRPERRHLKVATLHVIEPVLVRVPDIDNGAVQHLAIRRPYCAFHIKGLA
jgi:hypothetical protein